MRDTFFNNDKIYIHYGHDNFDINTFISPRNRYKKPEGFRDRGNEVSFYCSKPIKGFWGSPIDSEYGWDEWRKEEEYGDYNNEKNIKFRVIGNIYYINSVEKAYALRDEDGWIDWGKVFEEYDAVEISLTECPELYDVLYGWDVDSIVVGNPESIEIIG